jgi:3-deoxy-manno-octulosonate cytidylyltransferase (CMP-KDO synthetase)
VRASPASLSVLRFVVHPGFPGGPPDPPPPFSAVAVIPARYGSSRFPGKALASIGGRPMIEHVYRRAAAARSLARVIVATDDERIRRAVEGFGGLVRLTRPDHATGTDRIAEVAAALDASVIVNLQGDEPLIHPGTIDEAVAPLRADPALQMSTVCRRIHDPAELQDPHVTKVVVDRQGYALYFSRAPIPHRRAGAAAAPAFKHIGLYVYRRDFLLTFAGLARTPLERSEALEQLRALEHGHRIRVVETAHDAVGVDTPEDLQRVRRLLAEAAPAP